MCDIKYMVSLRSLVEDKMKEFGNNYFAHTFGLSSHIKGTHEGDITRMRDYFDADRLGLQSIAHRDVNCWKLQSVTSVTSTENNTPVYASTQETTGDDDTISKSQK